MGMSTETGRGWLSNSKGKPITPSTTSTEDSGLLDVLVPRFEKERRIEVKVIAVGSGAALRMAEPAAWRYRTHGHPRTHPFMEP